MKAQNFTAAYTVDQTPEEVFAAINNVRGWFTSMHVVYGFDPLRLAESR
jgi:hypothetical protein